MVGTVTTISLNLELKLLTRMETLVLRRRKLTPVCQLTVKIRRALRVLKNAFKTIFTIPSSRTWGRNIGDKSVYLSQSFKTVSLQKVRKQGLQYSQSRAITRGRNIGDKICAFKPKFQNCQPTKSEVCFEKIYCQNNGFELGTCNKTYLLIRHKTQTTKKTKLSKSLCTNFLHTYINVYV